MRGSQAVRTYSGGMKRRLSVAIACLGNPRVLILDEPTTGLDPISRRQVWTLIEDMKPGRAVLLTTHNLADANSLADKVLLPKPCFGTVVASAVCRGTLLTNCMLCCLA